MRTSLSIRRATTWLWGIIAFDIALIFVLAGWQITPVDIGWAFVMSAWLLFSVGGTAVGLTICYRRHFARWRAWLLLIALWFGGSLVVQGFVHIPQVGLSLLSTMVFLFSWVSLFVALCIRLYQCDFGISLIGWMTGLCVWSAVIMWRAHGDLIEAMFQTMEQPDQPSPVQWLSLLFTNACCLIPIALFSFAWHTGVLLWREKRGTMPPCEYKSE